MVYRSWKCHHHLTLATRSTPPLTNSLMTKWWMSGVSLVKISSSSDRDSSYGVATVSRLLKIVGLFCKRALQKRRYFAKETDDFDLKEPTNRRHPIKGTLKEIATPCKEGVPCKWVRQFTMLVGWHVSSG